MLTQLISALLLFQVKPAAPSFTQAVNNADGTIVMRTATQKMTSPGKPDVLLVGVVHIGLKKYYSDLQKILNEQEVVLYEGVKADKDSVQPPKVDPKGPKPVYQVLSDALGLDFQLVDIDYKRPGWINSDLSMEELNKLNAAKSGGKPTMFDNVKQLLDPNSPMAKMLSSFLQNATPGTREAIKILMVKQAASANSTALGDAATVDVVLKARNQSVLNYFDKAIGVPTPPKSVAIFYGALHMAEISEMLTTKYGYKSVKQDWYTVAVGDTKKVDAQGKALLDAFDKGAAKGGGRR